jgi:hypothetical protein
MLERSNPYYRQVELVMRVLPLVAREPRLALKGGTAINLGTSKLTCWSWKSCMQANW